MSKEYSQQQITSFFQQFIKLENSFTKEKVHQIINDPSAKARYKVKNFKPLNLIIMTFLISISIVLALLYSTPEDKQLNNTVTDITSFKQEAVITKNSTQKNNSVKEPEVETVNELIEEKAAQGENSLAMEKKQLATKDQAKLILSDTIVDGSKFILELSNDEIEKLGFQINHYTVFYRNSYNNRNVFYLATHSNGRFSVRGDSAFYNMKDYNPLQTDTISENCSMKYMKITKVGMGHTQKDRRREDIEYFISDNSFYPLFNTNQTGEIETINDQLNFNELADTLMPVVIKCSQLDLEIKRDQFFWFITNDDFYSNLPERYGWVKAEFETLKSAKRKRANKLDVDFKIEDWNTELLIPEGVTLNGQDFIVQFSKEELEKVGVFSHKKYGWSYSHRTPNHGSSLGGETEIINGRPVMRFDTIFNVDYYIKYSTDFMGRFLAFSTTIQQMDKFFNDDDILLPVHAQDIEDRIFWFTLSDGFWNLVPERYSYLKEHYDKMLYNKSITPDRDFVKYFTDPFEKVGVDVSLIELSKEELEKIGFKFGKIGTQIMTRTSPEGVVEKIARDQTGTEISCGFGKNWIQYRAEDLNLNMPKKMQSRIKKRPPYERVEYISPNKSFARQEWADKFDSLYAAANQGYQFVYITDSLGRHMSKINIQNEDIQINGEDFKHLIPIMVRNSKVANPLAEDRVFWFTPTEAFFDRLPDRIKDDIKREYNIVSSEGKSSELSACTYFESCKSTLKVDNLKIYPNPAQTEITIDFNLDTAQEGEISIANIAGLQIKVLKPKSNFDEGFNSIKCQLEGLKPGIYLVSIVTAEGFKTERIIISE